MRLTHPVHRIMVLDAGNLAEFDSPQVLLQKEDGLFKSLWVRATIE
jgi:ABC-type multidrug transport system fused ATPase/permease subunit